MDDVKKVTMRTRLARVCAAVGTAALVAWLPAVALAEDASAEDGGAALEATAETVEAAGAADGAGDAGVGLEDATVADTD